jgi:hypothetical protein
MFTIAKHFAIACVAVIALNQPVSAQWSFGQRPIYGQTAFPINRNPQIAPGLSLQQYAFNVRVTGNAYRGIPPYLLGYNPYPSVVGYGSGYYPRAAFTPYNTAVSNYLPYNSGYYAYPNYGANTGYIPYYGGNAYTGGYTTGNVDPLTGQPRY